MTTERTKVIQIVFCYANEDEKLINKFITHSVELQREKLINIWDVTTQVPKRPVKGDHGRQP